MKSRIISWPRRSWRQSFTLIELLIVIVIIAILMAVAIPTFLNQRQKAQDSSAQQNLVNALLEMKSQYTGDQAYNNDQIAAAAADEPALHIVTATANPYVYGQVQISIPSSTDQEAILTDASQDGNQYCIAAVENNLDASQSPTGQAVAASTYLSWKDQSAAEAAGCSAATGGTTTTTTTTTTKTTDNYDQIVEADNPIDFWPLDDSSPFGNHGQAAATLGTSGNNIATGQTGIPGEGSNGGSISLAGNSNDSVPNSALGSGSLCPTSSCTISAPFTVEAWVKLAAVPVASNGNSGNDEIINTRDPNNGEEFAYDLDICQPTSGAMIIHSDIGNGSSWIDTNADIRYTFQANTWYYIVETVGTDSNFTFYVNGVDIGNTSVSANGNPLFINSSNRVVIGSYLNGSNVNQEDFDGNISDVAVYGSILSSTQITNHYNAGN